MKKVGQKVLEQLVTKLGGPEQAARQLGVTSSLIQRFAEGQVPVPDSLMLKALDLLAAPDAPPPALLPQSPKPKGPPVI
jgi:hypothetical protein